jgi:hypothetical protein
MATTNQQSESSKLKAARAAYEYANKAWADAWFTTPAGSAERKSAAVIMQRAAREYRIATREEV